MESDSVGGHQQISDDVMYEGIVTINIRRRTVMPTGTNSLAGYVRFHELT
jgi:hypothetical protein